MSVVAIDQPPILPGEVEPVYGEKFIVLSLPLPHGRIGKVCVNLTHVYSIRRHEFGSAEIRYRSGEPYVVTETFDDVLAMRPRTYDEAQEVFRAEVAKLENDVQPQ